MNVTISLRREVVKSDSATCYCRQAEGTENGYRIRLDT